MVTTAPQLLDAQLDLLDQRAGDGPGRQAAIYAADVEDLIALALETLERIRRRCDAHNQNGGKEDGQALLNYWRRWHEIAVRALAGVEAAESQGRRLEQADAFRFAINEASIAVDWERVLAAQQRLESGGGGRTLEEIENALRRQA